jgi:ABC-type uncharacterized transport system fused permease/ATPase subunit
LKGDLSIMLGKDIEEIRQKQKKMYEHSQASTEFGSANDWSQIIVALGGVAAGLTLAVIVLLAYSIVTTGHFKTIIPKASDVSHTDNVKKSSDNIAQLNRRVKLLTETVSSLEAKLMRVMELTVSISNIEEKHASFSQEDIHEADGAKSASDINESNALRAIQVTSEIKKPFLPTHTVKVRLNLRPTATLNSRPITTLKVGTEVQYISQSDGWDYVYTRLHGKGWCSSGNLSPLLQTQQKSSAN